MVKSLQDYLRARDETEQLLEAQGQWGQPDCPIQTWRHFIAVFPRLSTDWMSSRRETIRQGIVGRLVEGIVRRMPAKPVLSRAPETVDALDAVGHAKRVLREAGAEAEFDEVAAIYRDSWMQASPSDHLRERLEQLLAAHRKEIDVRLVEGGVRGETRELLEYAFLLDRITYAQGVSEEARRVEPHLIDILSAGTARPEGFFGIDPNVRRSWVEEAKARAGASGTTAAPGVLACPLDKWRRLMAELHLQMDSDGPRYIWHLPWSSARHLISVLEARKHIVRTSGAPNYGGVFCSLFVKYRRNTRIPFGPQEAGGELTRSENQPTRKKSPGAQATFQRIGEAVRQNLG